MLLYNVPECAILQCKGWLSTWKPCSAEHVSGKGCNVEGFVDQKDLAIQHLGRQAREIIDSFLAVSQIWICQGGAAAC